MVCIWKVAAIAFGQWQCCAKVTTIGHCNELVFRLKRFKCPLNVDVKHFYALFVQRTIWAIIWHDIVDVDLVLLLHRISVAFVHLKHRHTYTKWLVANRSMQSVCRRKIEEKVKRKTQIKRNLRRKKREQERKREKKESKREKVKLNANN